MTPEKTQHELDYAVDYRAILTLQKNHLYIFESFYKRFQENERPTNRNKVIITVLTALGGITLGFLAGFALGSIGGPIAAIISGILGAIGGVTGGIIGFSLVKTPKSNDYLHNMYLQGKETFANLNAEDTPELNYVIGELASCERGRKILKYHEKFGSFSKYDFLYLPISKGKNKGKTPLTVLMELEEIELANYLRERYPNKECHKKCNNILQQLTEKDPQSAYEFNLLKQFSSIPITEGRYKDKNILEILDEEGSLSLDESSSHISQLSTAIGAVGEMSTPKSKPCF